MIFKTDLLYTGNSKPIKNGMLRLDKKGAVLEVGTKLSAEPSEVQYFSGAICPGFINTHCHLELSHMKGKVKQKTRLPGFVKELQQKREATKEEVQTAIKKADSLMESNGIVAVGDICNGDSTFEIKSNSNLYYHNFIELFAFDPAKAKEVYEKGIALKKLSETKGLPSSIVPHSPYSVSTKLFELIAQDSANRLLSIHNQETESENELYQDCSGAIKEMLEQFGFDLSNFPISKSNSLPAYLKRLPRKLPLLLVHNTYTDKIDIATANRIHQNLYWCFCPNANLYIEGQVPNIYQFQKEELKCTIGTDSLASNHTLSILDEMKLIQEKFPQIRLENLIIWACKNGADFLGLDYLGSIEVGKKPGINWIKNLEKGQLSGNSEVKKLA